MYKMSRNVNYFETYKYWDVVLNECKGYLKRLSPNTVIRKDMSSGNILLQLHGYSIVEQTSNNNFILQDAGWQTHTTKKRLNQFSPATIYQKNFIWIVSDPINGDTSFDEGVVVNMRGEVIRKVTR